MLGMEYCRAMLYSRDHELQINDKALFAKICNADCTFDTLEPFVVAINSSEIYMADSIDLYYNINKILKVIEKYQSGQVDKKFLSYWVSAYQWILRESFDPMYQSDLISDHDDRITLKEYLFNILSDMLDSLKFFDKDEVAEYFDFEKFKSDLKCLDTVIKDEMRGRIKAVFAPHGDYHSEVALLVSNDTDKYFVKMFGYLNFEDFKIEFRKVSYATLSNSEKRLRKQGYKDLAE